MIVSISETMTSLSLFDPYLTWVEMLSFLFSHQALILYLAAMALAFVGLSAKAVYQKLKLKSDNGTGSQQRFRKRDKMLFYGRKMLRKVRYLSNQTVEGKRIKKRQMVLKLAKRLLRMKRDQPSTLLVMEPSQAFLEEAISDSSDHRLPPEVMYMLRSIRVFGFFEKPLFLELCKNIEATNISPGDLLFSIGEHDDSIYIVQTGKVVVYITEIDGSELILREVGPGENITSLLSVMDVLTGHTAPYKTVSAKALEDSSILRLKVDIFRDLLEKDPESLVRVAQVIMVRLQRVTFTALHHYLGFTTQLIKADSRQSKRPSTILSPKTSPSRPSLRRSSQSFSSRLYLNDPHLLERLQDDNEKDNDEAKKNVPSTNSEDSSIHKDLSPNDESSAGQTDSGIVSLQSTVNFDPSSLQSTYFPKNDYNSKSKDCLEKEKVSDSRDMPSETTTSDLIRFSSEEKMDVGKSFAPSEKGSTNLTDNIDSAVIKSGHAVFTPFHKKPEVRNAPDGQEASKPRKRKASFFLPPSIKEDNHSLVVKGFARQLDLDDNSVLKDFVSVKEFPANTYIIREETVEDVALLYVLAGSLSVSQKTVDKLEDNELFLVHVDEIMGALAVLSGEPSLFTVRTRNTTIVGMLSKKHIYEILRQKPRAVLHLAQSVIERLSPFVRQIDFALDWTNIESGRAIYRQDDQSDSTYILLSGRLRSVLNKADGKKELVGEYGRGDLIGIVELLTSTRRATTVMAVRNSELAKLPEGLLNTIKIKHPEVVTRLIHLLGHRILGTIQKGIPTGEKAVALDSRPTSSNFATVAIVPVTENVPLFAFTMELYYALTTIGPTLRLTSDIIKKSLGPTILASTNEYRLCSWLGQQEDQHRIVLYQCDPHFTTWTRRCVQQADCILLVAIMEGEPFVGRVEKELESFTVRTQKELVLLHREDWKPRNTVQWLNIRSWCSSHHHIRCPNRMFTKRSPSRLTELYEKIFENPPSIHSDFGRLARFLTGTSFGLVLGGGGARGAAHVGMIKAIKEAGIPIDMIGGVSIGAFMGALWCQENDMTPFTQKAREWSFKMNSYWRQIIDLTYPATAMFTGAAFNRTIHEVFQERQIEDLWLPYFTVTTDITESTMRVHTHGSLWRYIRSSMSLSGYMPPLCDPLDGHLLLDGGYVNNLPADIMKDMGAETIIAVDVGSQDDIDLTNYGDTLNGWWLLWKKWNPWATPVKVPSLQEIQSRLAYVSCVKQLDQLKRSDYCTYVRPPIDKYKTLQFGSFDEIMDVGYNHGKSLFPAMKEGHKMLLDMLHKQNKYCHTPTGTLRNASFTDLAEMVCKIQKPRRIHIDNVSDDEDTFYMQHRGGYVSDPETSFLNDSDKEDDGEDFSPDQQTENIGSYSDVEYSAEREL